MPVPAVVVPVRLGRKGSALLIIYKPDLGLARMLGNRLSAHFFKYLDLIPYWPGVEKRRNLT